MDRVIWGGVSRMDMHKADWDSGDKGRLWGGSIVGSEGAAVAARDLEEP